ncbi:conserved protein of unknown function [Nitrospira japonica]|uniref:Periplasmic heavy metal sensor n=1 Tax=Nitrospira japonica TaxID=1325564 RepID=A0A1W1I0G7_9BACT|nr:hypothetical protein [Nitrospira japonica]SLM46496.1 conserved protein of unknown function [Nitrospira japonica]
MSRPKLWAGLAVLFAAGALTGVVGMWLYGNTDRMNRSDQGPAAKQERIMKRLTQELSLTTQQQTDIEPVVRRAHLAVLELRFSHQAEVERILTQGMAELKPKLSPEQQAGLDRLYAELQQRWHASRNYVQAQRQAMPRP